MLRNILLLCLISLTGCGKTWIGSTIPGNYEGVCLIENSPQNCEWRSEEFNLQYVFEKTEEMGEYLIDGEVEYSDSEHYYELFNGFITLLFLEKSQDGWLIYDTRPGTMQGSYDVRKLVFRNTFFLPKSPDAVTAIFRFQAKGN